MNSSRVIPRWPIWKLEFFVRTVPGHTQLTLTLSGARSIAMFRVICTTAAFVVLYVVNDGCAIKAEIEPTFTIDPPPYSLMICDACLLNKAVPTMLTLTDRSQSLALA